MLGAIIGDVVGSRFEFDNIRTKEFDLIGKGTTFTDDTVMTCAVDAVLAYGIDPVKALKAYGRVYSRAGYGGRFSRWLFSDDTKPYHSYGNGSAMRVSGCGWKGKSEEEVKELSRKVTEITHDHPEGLRGAEVTALCVYYARTGKSKEFIREYVQKEYPVLASLDYEELRRTYVHEEETCQNTVPQAIYCFLISKDFEDCLRTTISIGGDSDTTAAISCAIAEAYYGIPESIKKDILALFDKEDRESLLQSVNDLAEQCGIKNYIVL